MTIIAYFQFIINHLQSSILAFVTYKQSINVKINKLKGAFLLVAEYGSNPVASFDEDEVEPEREDGHDDKGKLTNGIVGKLLLLSGKFEAVVLVEEGG